MLTHLTVSKFAIVDYLDLEFDAGMSVVTGETGAGKSIMLNALSLTLGDRAESGLIAPGQDKAEISTEFEVGGNEEATGWLKERDLLMDESRCILRRVLNVDGRSRGYINGTPATVQDMKHLGNMLIDVHSQHEHQSLLKKETHRRLLDEFGGLSAEILALNTIYEAYRKISAELTALTGDNTDQSARLQLLTYQADELAEAAIEKDEHITLEAEHKRLANAEVRLQQAGETLNILVDGEFNSKDQLVRAIQLLSGIDDVVLDSTIDQLTTSRIQIEEAAADLKRLTDSYEIDPERLREVESRLGTIFEIARKHHVRPEEITQTQAQINEELEKLNHLGTHIEDLNTQLASLKQEYSVQAQKLKSDRTNAAGKLQKLVEDQLASLGMKESRFVISVEPKKTEEPQLNGLEDIEFLISTNPGQPPRALNKIASGGELSRISLAIQVVTANSSRVPTLVFDEVDVGVSGGIAEVVGNLLRQLGEQAQIICITHAPQVAAQGHRHYLVSKIKTDLQSETKIDKLDENATVNEIARMLGGVTITDQSLAHAEEMFRTAQQ